uniref:Uncharacterized protein n=1 Tax=Anguilla anguilla TaxID=7936 RepID=A0A0E9WBW6_ANGAN
MLQFASVSAPECKSTNYWRWLVHQVRICSTRHESVYVCVYIPVWCVVCQSCLWADSWYPVCV